MQTTVACGQCHYIHTHELNILTFELTWFTMKTLPSLMDQVLPCSLVSPHYEAHEALWIELQEVFFVDGDLHKGSEGEDNRVTLRLDDQAHASLGLPRHSLSSTCSLKN